MPEQFIEKTKRVPAKTTLTPPEKVLLYQLQGKMKTESEADTIRMVLRDRYRAEGLMS